MNDIEQILSYMDAEDGLPPADSINPETAEPLSYYIDGLMSGNPDTSFTLEEIQRKMLDEGIRTSISSITRALGDCEFVSRVTGKNKTIQVRSTAPPLPLVNACEGNSNNGDDDLGLEARQDFFSLGEKRRLGLKRKIVRKF